MWLFSESGCLLSRNECWFWLFSKLVCVNQMKRRDIFIIRDVEWRSTFFSSVKFVVCCKNFEDFQTDLYVKTNSFPLKSVVCNYNWARAEADDHVDFHYCIFLWKITTIVTMIVTLITVVVTMTLTVDKLTVLLAVFVFVEWEPVWSLLGFVWSVEILFLRYFTQKMHLLEKNTFLVW